MFNKKVILTILVAMITCFIVGAFFSEPDNEELLKQMFIYKVHANKKYDLVVAGDSRVYRGISTDVIGNELNKTSINLGFSSGGFNKTMFDLIDKKLNKKNGNVIVLGVSPFSLTDQAIENGHINRVKKLKNEEIIESLYLKMILNIFVPSDPITIWNNIFKKDQPTNNYVQKVNIKEGWVKSDNITPHPYYALPSYNHTFTNTKISQQTIDNLYNQIHQWTNMGYLVFGFVPPSSYNIEELERQYSVFNDNDFAQGFLEAGGKWISFDELYTSFDGSHLNSKSAIKVSNEIASAIKTKTFLSQLEDEGNIRTKYCQFESKFTYLNDFENDTTNILDTDNAYSGNQVLYCGHNTKYLGLYSTTANSFLNNNVKTVLVDIQVYYEKENISAKLVIEIKQDGQNILWKGLEITNIVKPSNWGRVRLEAFIPNNISATDKLKIYIINDNESHIFVDDFKLDMY